MSTNATLTIYALSKTKAWGRQAVRRYLERLGVPLGLLRIAQQLSAAQKGGF